VSDERRLTKPQRDELAALAKNPQQTFGKARTAVQNRLVGMGLAVFTSQGTTELCEITPAGRTAVVTGLAHKSESPVASRPLRVANVTAIVDPPHVDHDPKAPRPERVATAAPNPRDVRILELEAENRKLVNDGARIIASWENRAHELERLLAAACMFLFGEGEARVVVESDDNDGAGPPRWSVTGANLIPTCFDSRGAAIEEAKRRSGGKT
jgi:hypothetical protein